MIMEPSKYILQEGGYVQSLFCELARDSCPQSNADHLEMDRIARLS